MMVFVSLLSCLILQVVSSPIPGGTPRQQPTLVKQWGTIGNQYPTVFIHGLLGFSEATPLLGFMNYWGGATQNILTTLRSNGYTVSAPGVGPLSSNWERACEVYAQIAGVVTDYGIARAHQFGHYRFGKAYSANQALVPGFMQATSKTKINIVGHSMGGPTARLLVHLLEFGSQAELDACVQAQTVCSPLFWTNKTRSYVNGVFAISGAHQGSPFDDELQSNGGFLDFFKQAVISLVGANNWGKLNIYDLQLGHWGLNPYPSEDVDDYFARIQKSAWLKSKSHALFDLSIQAQSDSLVSFVKNAPDTTYFSVAGITTSFDGRYANAELSTFIFLAPIAEFVGSYSNASLPLLSTFSPKEWRQNDGLVPLASSRGPASGFTSFPIDLESGSQADLTASAPRTAPGKGVYHFVGILDHADHAALIGVSDIIPGQRDDLYLNIMRILASLSP
ncbi:UNVERIFIED_CONTAM: hypothetical protein HDU68_003172 [Siphonaria sp. JEL0065]|nr:hypothetical protein HDU68_003172 [Siphonaria sp. JEL0065]